MEGIIFQENTCMPQKTLTDGAISDALQFQGSIVQVVLHPQGFSHY